jgi:hypothetical protein
MLPESITDLEVVWPIAGPDTDRSASTTRGAGQRWSGYYVTVYVHGSANEVSGDQGVSVYLLYVMPKDG